MSSVNKDHIRIARALLGQPHKVAVSASTWPPSMWAAFLESFMISCLFKELCFVEYYTDIISLPEEELTQVLKLPVHKNVDSAYVMMIMPMH